MSPAVTLSIIVPCLNEAEHIGVLVDQLSTVRERGAEVIVVDGGSDDATVALARTRCDVMLVAKRGRAKQMNAGAARAQGEVLWFLHADSVVPDRADDLILDALHAKRRFWGRFDVRIAGSHSLLKVISAAMNLRSRLSGICTGDQGLFVKRHVFEALGGFPDIPLMEDVALAKRLKQLARPVCLRQRIVTSGRRWEKHGVARTTVLMWRLRFAYWRGANPAELALQYAPHTQR
jgi:rSAM/selenodomain-associated transferase 2